MSQQILMAVHDRALRHRDMAEADQAALSGHYLLRRCSLVLRGRFRATLK
jgi:hypothetical protein